MTKLFTATCRMAGSLAVATFALLAVAPVAQAQPSSLTAFYDPATGNIKLQNTTSSVLEISSFNLLTLGNGSIGSATPNSEGYLNNAVVATTPIGQGVGFANGSSFRVRNNLNGAGASSNGAFSQIAATLFPDVDDPLPLFTLSAYSGWSVDNPIGLAGSYWDVGNVAAIGMSPADLNARFLTTTSAFGKFDYGTLAGTGITPLVGNVVSLAAVPEPSTLALAGAGVAGLGYWRLRRRQG
jgi:hypothetical protein